MSIISIVTTLLLIMDPIGNMALFSVITSQVKPERRMRVIMRELLISLFLMLFFLFVGKSMLAFLQLRKESLMIAGAIILFVIAIDMIFKKQGAMPLDDDLDGEPFIIPMATPLIAGPSLFATIVIFSTTYEDNFILLILAVCIAWLINSFILLLTPLATRLLKRRGMKAMEKLMGMLLVALSVQMFLNGVIAFIEAV